VRSNQIIKTLVIERIIKDEKAFEALIGRLKGAYTRAWGKQVQPAIAAALDTLRAMDPEEIAAFTDAHAQKIITAIERFAGGAAMQAVLRGPVINLSDALYALGLKEVAAMGVDIKFGLPDADALAVISDANLFWVGQHWNSYTHERFNSILSDYFGKGMTRVQLAERMAQDFAGFSEKGSVYWELMADHTATKTRELGRVDAYQQAGVKKVVVRAHLDDRTTPICRALHGKVLSVTQLSTQKTEYLDAVGRMDVTAAKKIWPMMGEKDAEKIEGAKRLPKKIGSPPYHFRCRTITVVQFDGAAPAATSGDISPADIRQVKPGTTLPFGEGEKFIRAAAQKGVKKEYGFAVGLGDEILLARPGNAHNITFTEAEIEMFAKHAGNIQFSHNHPSGGSFSYEDISFQLKMGLAKMRAIGDKYSYTMELKTSTAASDGVVQKLRNVLKAHYDNAGRIVREIFNGEIEAGKMDIKTANLTHHHEVWQRIVESERYKKYLTYKREKTT
jgi:SPP1 gp7 family putative phage head morphogenesis protein